MKFGAGEVDEVGSVAGFEAKKLGVDGVVEVDAALNENPAGNGADEGSNDAVGGCVCAAVGGG